MPQNWADPGDEEIKLAFDAWHGNMNNYPSKAREWRQMYLGLLAIKRGLVPAEGSD